MFALVVVLADMGWNRLDAGVEQGGAKRKPGDVLEDVGVLDGFFRRFSPGEGGVAGYKNSGDGNGIKAPGAEPADDDGASTADIAGRDFFGGKGFGHRNRAVEVVGVGRAEAGNRLAGLSPGGGEF